MLKFTALSLLVLASCHTLFAHEGCILSGEAEAFLAADRVFDSVIGKDTRNYPPDIQVDFDHLKLEIDMPSPESKSFTAVETLTFKALGLAVKSLKLNAVELKIEKVTDLDGNDVPFRTDDEHLHITFATPLAPAAAGGVKIHYSVTDPKDGMTFALPDAGYPNRPLQIHSQGQAETNRYWFAAHDYPNERMTSELIVTIPSRYKALGNGALVDRKELDGGMVRYHYKLAKPHVSYLVSLVIGEFDVYTDEWRDVPVEYWVAPGSKEADVRRTFSRTPAMMEKMSELTGAYYPYEKYAQSVVYLFSAGGMENTSTTTLTEDMLLDDRAALDNDREGLIAHELGHQWFGDMLTCKSWQHIWLNEGFATYMDAAWQEHGFSRDHYDYDIWGNMRRVTENDDVSATGGLVWPYYENAGETFRRGVSNPYPKGASILHMLRMNVGDDLFWKTIQAYVKRHAWSSVESDDLRKAFDETTGRSFEQFFQQWVYRPGAPIIKAEYDWDAGKGEATITLTQTQTIAEKSPAFFGEIPVEFVTADGKRETRSLVIDARVSRLVVRLDGEPSQIHIDPRGGLLAKWQWKLPVRMLAAVATNHDASLSTRLNAVAALAKKDRDESRSALNAVLNNEKAFFGLRVEAAKALGTMQSPAAGDLLLATLADGKMVADHKVRRAVVEALGEYRTDEVASVLRRIATADASYSVEAAATESLGKQWPSDANRAVLLANVQKPAYRDVIRVAAAKALGQLADARDAGIVESVAAYGQPFRTRPAAIDALGEFKNQPAVREALIKLLADPQERARNNAIDALGKLGDEKAVADLQRLANSAADQPTRDRVRRAIEAINKRTGESSAVKDLRERVEKLEKARTRESDE